MHKYTIHSSGDTTKTTGEILSKDLKEAQFAIKQINERIKLNIVGTAPSLGIISKIS